MMFDGQNFTQNLTLRVDFLGTLFRWGSMPSIGHITASALGGRDHRLWSCSCLLPCCYFSVCILNSLPWGGIPESHSGVDTNPWYKESWVVHQGFQAATGAWEYSEWTGHTFPFCICPTQGNLAADGNSTPGSLLSTSTPGCLLLSPPTSMGIDRLAACPLLLSHALSVGSGWGRTAGHGCFAGCLYSHVAYRISCAIHRSAGGLLFHDW